MEKMYFRTCYLILFIFSLTIHDGFSEVLGHSARDLATLYQEGEAAFKRNAFEEAEQCYSLLWKQMDKEEAQHSKTQWVLKASLAKDVTLKYFLILTKLGNTLKAKKILERSLQLLPPHIVPELYYEKAKLLCANDEPQEAFILLHEYRKNHLKEVEWPFKMRSFYKALEYSLKSYYNELMRDAEEKIITGKHEEAKTALKEIAQGIERGIFPDASSKK